MNTEKSAKQIVKDLRIKTKKLSESTNQTLEQFNRLEYLKKLIIQIESEFNLQKKTLI